MVAAIASSSPPPRARPSTAATDRNGVAASRSLTARIWSPYAVNDAASIAARCLISAPAAKNLSSAEDTTMALTSPAASAASSAACSPSSSGALSALAGGEAIVTRQIPGAADCQVTTSFG
jgi:hypothetical protein